MGADQTRNDDWRWLNQALFGADDGFALVQGRGRSPAQRWAVLPNGDAPRRLVPADSRAAAASFANVHDAMSKRRLAMGRVTRAAVARGLPLSLRGTAELPGELGLGGDPTRSLLAEMGDRLGVGGAQVAITLGPRRYNRKPVVQVIDGGATVAFVKVACDETTGAFVDNETRWLARAAEAESEVLVPPAVLAAWESQHVGASGQRLLAVSPIHPSTHTPELLDAARRKALTRDIARLGPQLRAPVSEASILERATDDAAAAGDDRLATAVERVLSAWGDREVEVGPWHGDLTPWNTITSGPTTALLDWEFAAEGMPVGADLIHNSVMVDTHLSDVAIGDALQAVRGGLAELLIGFANATELDATFALYLLELGRRDARLASLGQASTGFGPASLDMLDRLTA